MRKPSMIASLSTTPTMLEVSTYEPGASARLFGSLSSGQRATLLAARGGHGRYDALDHGFVELPADHGVLNDEGRCTHHDAIVDEMVDHVATYRLDPI